MARSLTSTPAKGERISPPLECATSRAVAIVGERPLTGVRIAIERPRDGGPPWSYAGSAFLPDATFSANVTVSEAGDVDVTLEPDPRERGAPPPSDLAEKIRLIVRTVWKQAKSDGEPPAFRIVRWRADK
jgi:hypothetical protein